VCRYQVDPDVFQLARRSSLSCVGGSVPPFFGGMALSTKMEVLLTILSQSRYPNDFCRDVFDQESLSTLAGLFHRLSIILHSLVAASCQLDIFPDVL
jgi:hypothetical protein